MSDLAKKLRLKNGIRMATINAPESYQELLGELPDDITIVNEADLKGTADHSLDFVQLFVGSVAELEKLSPEAIRTIQHDGMLWICYPKKTSKIKTDINRDSGWDVVREAGLEGVSLISVNDTWSAMRFRPIKK